MDRLFVLAMALFGSLTVIAVQGADARSAIGFRSSARGAQVAVDAGFQNIASQHFNIASQPLHTALDAFGVVTGWSGLYSAETTADQMSRPLSGWYTPDVALHLLIDGSGMEVYYTAADAFVLESSAQPSRDALNKGTQSIEALLQSSVRQAFCREPQLASGDYRIAFSLRLGAHSQVEEVHLLGSTGNTARDAVVLSVLQIINIKADLGSMAGETAQTFVMLILPRPKNSRECAASP